MNEILFTDTRGVISDFLPKPAKKNLPDWYKNTPSYQGDKKEISLKGVSSTIKKCTPVFDILNAGYIIPTWADLWVKKENGKNVIFSSSPSMEVDWHPNGQISLHPEKGANEVAFKFINPWSIRTPKGHSVLFTPPFHNPNPYFEVLSAIVDTDTYYTPTNFPFFLKDCDFEGVIPAGTPMVQVIPFKRQTWKMNFGTTKDEISAAKNFAELRTSFFQSYRNRFWNKKEFN